MDENINENSNEKQENDNDNEKEKYYWITNNYNFQKYQEIKEAIKKKKNVKMKKK
jgi:hypothetical protein